MQQHNAIMADDEIHEMREITADLLAIVESWMRRHMIFHVSGNECNCLETAEARTAIARAKVAIN